MIRDGGKGDTQRPLVVSMEEFDKNFDAIFGNKKDKKGSNINVTIEPVKKRGRPARAA